MAFMKPVVEKLVMYHVESNNGEELVPESVCGDLRPANNIIFDGANEVIAEYTSVSGEEIKTIERKEGYYSRLSANGYLDCTDWIGPYETSEAALIAVKSEYNCDDEGNSLEDARESFEFPEKF